MPLDFVTLNSFIDGYNTRDADFLLKDTEMGSESRNVALSATGKPSKRDGYAISHTLPSNPKSIYRFYKESTGGKYTLTSASTFLYEGTTQKYSGLTSNQDFYFQDWYEDLVYMVNGKDGLFKFDGTSVTKATDTNINAIIPKFITMRLDRLFVANASELWWSDLGTPETFDGASIIKIPLYEGESVTGIKKIFNNVAVYKDRGIMVLRGGTDPNTYSLEDMNSAYGLIAPKTLCEIDGGHCGLSRDGIFFFNGSRSELLPGMDKVLNVIKNADPESIYNATMCYYDRKIILNFPSFGSSTNDTTLVYDLGLGVFLPLWTNIKANMFSAFMGKNDDNLLYFASANDNNVYNFTPGIYTDNDTAITWVLETKNLAIGGPESFKKNKKMRVDVENTSGTLGIQYKTDGGSYTTTENIPLQGSHYWGEALKQWGDGTLLWGDGMGMINYKVSNSSKSRFIKYKFTHSGTGNVEFVYVTQFYRLKHAK